MSEASLEIRHPETSKTLKDLVKDREKVNQILQGQSPSG